MSTAKHIVFLCSRLDLPGGIERAIVNTANLFHQQGQSVTLLVLDSPATLFYDLHPAIQVVCRPLHFGITEKGNTVQKKLAFIKHIFRLRKLFTVLRPDFIIGTEYHFSITAYFAARKFPAKIYSWEHHHYFAVQRSRFWQFFFRTVYPKLDRVICLNEEEKRMFAGLGCRTAVIPNFIEKNEKAAVGKKQLLTIGWLFRLKGVDKIPAIAEKIFRLYPDWHWTVIGTGEEEEALKKALHEKDLEHHVTVVHPTSPDLQVLYQTSSIYVMLSMFECFPMVLLEAMSHGLPCVAFNCPTGPAFIIDHEKNGYLVRSGDVDALAKSVLQLMEDAELRQRFGNDAYKAVERFSPAKMYSLWETILA